MLWIGIAAAADGRDPAVPAGAVVPDRRPMLFVVLALVSCFVYWRFVRPRDRSSRQRSAAAESPRRAVDRPALRARHARSSTARARRASATRSGWSKARNCRPARRSKSSSVDGIDVEGANASVAAGWRIRPTRYAIRLTRTSFPAPASLANQQLRKARKLLLIHVRHDRGRLIAERDRRPARSPAVACGLPMAVDPAAAARRHRSDAGRDDRRARHALRRRRSRCGRRRAAKPCSAKSCTSGACATLPANHGFTVCRSLDTTSTGDVAASARQ